MKHLIIGAGAAGITAARTIRSLRPEDDVVILTEDNHIVSRVMLHKYINEERDIKSLSFVEEDFLDKNQIGWIGGQTVTHIDPVSKNVTTTQTTFSYDKLLIAPGAKSTIPPICILDVVRNLYGFRSLEDAKAIREAALTGEKAVVIGAGLVGMAVAEALLDMGKEVAVVEMGFSILSLNLDERAALAYQSKFEEAGCKFYLGQSVTGTEVDSNGNINVVNLGDGTELPCDFVVAATGAKPEVDFLEESGIEHDRSLKVDQHLATNFPDVYGAGDVTGLSGIWPNAMRQGKIAGENMAGESVIYEDTFAVKNTVHFYGLLTLTIGTIKPEEGDRVEIREDRKGYRKLIIRDGRIVGLVLQGDISNSGFWQYLIKHNIPVDHLNKSIWKVGFVDFVSFNEEGEYEWHKDV